jgi:hypothetical protein
MHAKNKKKSAYGRMAVFPAPLIFNWIEPIFAWCYLFNTLIGLFLVEE